MKGLILLADGFEETEALVTIDILRRAKIQIDMISMMSSVFVKGAHQILIEAESLIDSICYQDYDFLIIPGGSAVLKELKRKDIVYEMIKDFDKKEKVIAAICAAPMLIGEANCLKNRKYICFKGFENEMYGGEVLSNQNVVIDHHLITAKSMYYTIDFALTIIEKLLNKDIALKIQREIMSL